MTDIPEPSHPEPPTFGPIRRAPRYGPFIATGGLLAGLVGVVLGLVGQGSDEFSRLTLVGFFGVGCGLLGGLFAALLAVILERRR